MATSPAPAPGELRVATARWRCSCRERSLNSLKSLSQSCILFSFIADNSHSCSAAIGAATAARLVPATSDRSSERTAANLLALSLITLSLTSRIVFATSFVWSLFDSALAYISSPAGAVLDWLLAVATSSSVCAAFASSPP